MKKRIVFLRRTHGFGGAEVVILDLLKRIDYARNAVYLASATDVFSTRLAKLGIPVEYVPLTARSEGGFVRILASWLYFLIRLRPDKIVMVEGGFFDFPLPAVLAASVVARGQLYMMELHPAPEPPPKVRGIYFGFLPGLGLGWYWSVYYLCLRAYLTRRTLALSRGVKSRLVAYYRYPPEKVDVVYHGVDTSRFYPASAELRKASRAIFNIPDEATVIVSAARLDGIKRLGRIIKVFGTTAPAWKNLWLLFTGEGPLREQLETLAKSVDTDHRIRFLGHIEDVRDALRVSDVYVLPSDEEGLGIALLEAMATKLICVATKPTGPAEIIEDGTNGFLADPSYGGVLEGLRRALLLSKEEWDSMTSSGRQTVLENFRLENAIARDLTLMEIDQVGVA